MDTKDRMLRLEEVAQRLAISYTQARSLVLSQNKIPHFKIGARGVRVKVEDLELFIKEREAKGSGSKRVRGAGHSVTREPYRGR